MPIATKEQYAQMLKKAQDEGYAYPAINVTSLATASGALRAFAEQKSDGIIQVSTGGAKFASGTAVGDEAFGAIVLAEAIHRLAEKYNVLIALHTDHCQPGKADSFLGPLLEASKERLANGAITTLFQSHMLDASELPLDENIALSQKWLKKCAELGIILEIEAGVVGGEEDGIDNSELPADKLYTSPEDMLAVYEGLDGLGQYIFAATFGNVHGAYKPGAVKLDPKILKAGQEAVIAKYGAEAEMDLVFHGGSGSELSDIRETLDYGVIKMNIDTDTQYAFTRAIVSHVCSNIEGVLKIDGEVGVKGQYDPRSYLKKAEISLCERMKIACDDLRSTGTSILAK